MESKKITIKTSARTAARKQQKTLGDSAVAYLVELITNADDSYKRLESKGLIPLEDKKPIYIVLKKENNCEYVLSVADNAEGFSSESVEKIFGEYGGDNAGGDTGATRGIFGQGATDVMVNASMDGKKAMLESFKDEQFCRYHFGWDENAGERTLTSKTPSLNVGKMKGLRESLMIPGNGTRMTFGVPSTVKFKEDGLLDELEGNYALRYILSQDNREVYLLKGKTKWLLSSKKYILAENELLADNKFSFDYEGHHLDADLKLFRNSNKQAEKDFHTDILVVDSNQVVFANTMFGYEKMPQAKDISGVLVIDGLYALCKEHLNRAKPDEIIRDDRTGFNDRHDFYKELTRQHLDKIIKDCLNQHGAPVEEVEITKHKKFKSALDAVNKWMSEELKRNIGGGAGHGIIPPDDGLAFGKAKIEVTAGYAYSLSLIINARLISSSDDIFIDLAGNDDGYISITPEVISYRSDEVKGDIVIKTISITANKANNEGEFVTLKASSLGYSKDIAVQVVAVDVIYPENGLEFETDEATFTPDGNHKSPLWFDTNALPLGTKVKFNSDGLTFIGADEVELAKSMMVTDHIGKFNVVTSGGELGNDYNLDGEVAEYAVAARQAVHIRNHTKESRGSKGAFSSIKLLPDETGGWQVTADDKTGTLYINPKHQINIEMMGDLSTIDPEKPAFNPKQSAYLAILIAQQAAITDVKELERKNQISINENDRLSDYLNQLDKKKLEVFARIKKAMAEA